MFRGINYINVSSITVILILTLSTLVCAQQVELGLPTGHTSTVNDVSFTPDHKHLVTSSDDLTTKIWDLRSGRVLATLNLHKSGVTGADIHSSGNYILTHSYDSTSILWDASNYKPINTFKTRDIRDLEAAFHPHKNEVAYLGSNNSIVIWDISKKRISHKFVGHDHPINCIDFNSDGTILASGDRNGFICLFNLKNGAQDAKFQAHASSINEIKFSPDNTLLISSSFYKTCKVWNLKNGKLKYQFKKFKNEVYGVNIHPNGKLAIITSNGDIIQLWNIEEGKRIKTFKGQDVFKGCSQYSPSGKYLFLGGSFNQSPAIYETQSFKKVCDLDIEGQLVMSAVFSKDESSIILGIYSVNEAKAYDIKSGAHIRSFKGDVSAIMSARFNPDGKRLLIATKSGSAIRCNLSQGRVDGYAHLHDKMVFDARQGQNEDILITSSEDNTSKFYNFETDSILQDIGIYGTWENQTRLSGDNQYILSATLDHKIECRKADDYSLVYQIDKDRFTEFVDCPSKDSMLVYSPYQKVELRSISQGEIIYTIPNYGYTVNQASINRDGDHVAILYAKTWKESIIMIWDVQKQYYTDSIIFADRVSWMTFDQTGQYLAYPSTNQTQVELYSINERNVVKQFDGHEFGALGASFSNLKNTICTVSGDKSVAMFDMRNSRLLKRTDQHKNSLSYIDVDPSGQLFITASWDGSFILWDAATGDFLQQWYFFENDPENMLIINKDGYYKASKKATAGIYFVMNNSFYPLEQFDLKYNRPDKVLQTTPLGDSTLISAYHSAYLKRLKKMGFTEDMLEDDFHLPEIEIENFEEMPSLHDQGSINLKLKLQDNKYKLDRINVWVNDVAIYGTDGISLRDKNLQVYETELEVFLAKGKNKVQVSVLNQVGAESYKETFEIECAVGKESPDLYLITIGESEFQQSDFNLTYAAKDAQDIVKLFEKNIFYGSVYSKTLTNEQVTKENITALSSFIEKADINDEVMIFIAGHGVLDANLDYYFATYDMDFQQPQKRGLAYDDLESLLDGIKPLKKTLLIDACHSGEIDKEEVQLAEADVKEERDIQFRVVGKTASPKLGTQNTSELTKSLFTDLRKGTGATVISSAGGMEFAMEGDDWNNGLFTYCFINGIKSKEADVNQDGEIWLSEIQQYVSKKVFELSGGRQQPTSRIENQTVDFRVW
jgi:WD40 repeat protein